MLLLSLPVLLEEVEDVVSYRVAKMSVAQKRVCFTGVRLSPLEGHGGVSALVVGEDCLLSGGYAGNVLEWPLSKLQAAVNAAKPHVTETPADCWLESRRDATQYCWIKCMQVRP